MGLGQRIYVVDENDALIRIPTARYERLYRYDPNEALPELAGKEVRIITVLTQNEDKMPVSISLIEGSYVVFDGEGKLSREWFEKQMHDAVESIWEPEVTSTGNIINAAGLFKKRSRKNQWELNSAMIDSVVRDVFKKPELKTKGKREILKEKPKRKRQPKPPLFDIEEGDDGAYQVGFDFQGICEEISKVSVDDYVIGTSKGFRNCIARFKQGKNCSKDFPPGLQSAILDHLNKVQEELKLIAKLLNVH